MCRFVFHGDGFASNVDDVSSEVNIAEALKKAHEARVGAGGGGSAFNGVARQGIRENYDGRIGDVQGKIGKLVGVEAIVLNPRFEENARMLRGGKEVRNPLIHACRRSRLSSLPSSPSTIDPC